MDKLGNKLIILNSEIAKKLIPAVRDELFSLHGVMPTIGAEVEFYLKNQDDKDAIFEEIQASCLRVEKEKGWEQYECVVDHSKNIEQIPQQLIDLRSNAIVTARKFGGKALFDAKPFEDDYGSALHMHISLHDEAGINLYSEGEINENQALQHSIGGMLDLLEESLCFICSEQSEFSRFIPKYMAPTNVSWGGNNRTTAIRIPDSKAFNRRIEYRTAPSSSNPYIVTLMALIGVHHGLTCKIMPPDRMYGDAFHPQYELPEFPKNIQDTRKIFTERGKLASYLSIFAKRIGEELQYKDDEEDISEE